MSNSPYCGMTLNERLFHAELLNAFDNAMEKRDRDAISQLLAKVDAEPSLVNTLLNDEVECWFCGNSIERDNDDALRIVLMNLWRNGDGEPSQEIYAHFNCALGQMTGARMSLERKTFAVENDGV